MTGRKEREAVPALRRFMALLIFASGLVAAPDPAIAQTAPTFTPRDESPEEFPAGAGREEAFYACTACHNFKLVAAQGLSRESWDASITWMTQRHSMPPLADSERKIVLDYLAGAYPARAPARSGGWQNPFTKQ